MKNKKLENITDGIIAVIGILCVITIFHFFGGGLIWICGLIMLSIFQLLLDALQVNSIIKNVCEYGSLIIIYICAVISTFKKFNKE